MCRLASFFFRPIDGVPMAVAVLDSHSDTQKKLKLPPDAMPDSWHEGHYDPNGTIECRCIEGDTKTSGECVAFIKAKWPTFKEFFNWAIKEGAELGTLDASGCDLKGLDLPAKLGTLYANGCDLKGVALPDTINVIKNW